jgi:hypothetical protein
VINLTESVQINRNSIILVPCQQESRLYLDGQMEPPKIRKKVMIRKAVLSLSMGPFSPSYFLYDTGEFVIWVQ